MSSNQAPIWATTKLKSIRKPPEDYTSSSRTDVTTATTTTTSTPTENSTSTPSLDKVESTTSNSSTSNNKKSVTPSWKNKKTANNSWMTASATTSTSSSVPEPTQQQQKSRRKTWQPTTKKKTEEGPVAEPQAQEVKPKPPRASWVGSNNVLKKTGRVDAVSKGVDIKNSTAGSTGATTPTIKTATSLPIWAERKLKSISTGTGTSTAVTTTPITTTAVKTSTTAAVTKPSIGNVTKFKYNATNKSSNTASLASVSSSVATAPATTTTTSSSLSPSVKTSTTAATKSSIGNVTKFKSNATNKNNNTASSALSSSSTAATATTSSSPSPSPSLSSSSTSPWAKTTLKSTSGSKGKYNANKGNNGNTTNLSSPPTPKASPWAGKSLKSTKSKEASNSNNNNNSNGNDNKTTTASPPIWSTRSLKSTGNAAAVTKGEDIKSKKNIVSSISEETTTNTLPTFKLKSTGHADAVKKGEDIQNKSSHGSSGTTTVFPTVKLKSTGHAAALKKGQDVPATTSTTTTTKNKQPGYCTAVMKNKQKQETATTTKTAQANTTTITPTTSEEDDIPLVSSASSSSSSPRLTSSAKALLEAKVNGTTGTNDNNDDNDASSSSVKKFSDVYVIGKELGKGAFSVVKEGSNKTDNEKYAIKIVTKAKLTAEDELGLKDEIEVLKTMRHKNIIRLYNVFEEPEYYYLVTEIMMGGELFDRVVEKNYYSEKEARDVCKILFEAIGYCHEHQVAHRDLKPENLLLQSKDDDSNIKIADFGFAKKCKGPKSLKTQCGTPGYVAPEILEAKPYDTQADMWSMGVIVYIVLGGYPPFIEKETRELFRKIRKGEFEFHEKYWNPVSKDAKDLISSLLTVNDDSRSTAVSALEHKWLMKSNDASLSTRDLGLNLEKFKAFNAKRKLKAAISSVVAANKFASLGINFKDHL